MSSRQLLDYLRLRFTEGLPLATAAFEAGISEGEAAMTDKAVASGEQPVPQSPPPLLDPTVGGGSNACAALHEARQHLRAGEPCATDDAHERRQPEQKGSDDMARRPKQSDAPISGEVAQPDFALAVRLWRNDIKPAQEKVGEYAQEQSTAYKAIKKQANIQPQAAKLAFKLDDMEEAKRDDFLRSFNGLLRELNIYMPADLVDVAEGKGSASDAVVPIGRGQRSKLATIPDVPADDSDLLGVDDDDTADADREPVAAE